MLETTLNTRDLGGYRSDQTGVVSALLHLLCGVRDEDIIYDYMIYDYMITKICDQPRFDLIHQNYPEVNMNIVIPQERYMREFLQLFREEFGGIVGYMDAIGVTKEEQKAIQGKLLLTNQ